MVGFIVYSAALPAGQISEPSVSAPIAAGAKPADTATAEPGDDPEVLRYTFQSSAATKVWQSGRLTDAVSISGVNWIQASTNIRGLRLTADCRPATRHHRTTEESRFQYNGW